MANWKAQLVLAHGAGQGMDSDFMQQCKTLLEQVNIRCTLFDFDYMVTMKLTGKRRPPDRMPILQKRFSEVLSQQDETPLFIGGKSMGGRVATHLLQSSSAHAAICLGYPFHPPGKPEKTRIAHFKEIDKAILVLQGERDPFGKAQEIEQYDLPENISIRYVKDGEHSFKPTKKSGISWLVNMQSAISSINQFVDATLMKKE